MRTFTALLLALWLGTATGDSAPRVISLMPGFWEVMGAPPNEAFPRTEQLRRFIAKHTALYGPVVPLDPEFDLDEYTRQLEALLPTMRELDARYRPRIDAGLADLGRRVGPLSDMTIYIAPSLFTSNGQVRVVDGEPVVMFGVDVQAYAELELLPEASRYDLRAYVIHELFHAHHYGVNPQMRAAANTLFDQERPVPVYLNLWIEGLATCVSMSLDGGGSPERALMSKTLPTELPPVLRAVAGELSLKFISRRAADTRDFFWMGGGRKDIPARSAYGVGALVADDIISRKGLTAALKLQDPELRVEVGTALHRLSRSDVKVDWSKVCPAPDTPRP